MSAGTSMMTTLALSANDWWTMLTGVLCCVGCGTIGCFLVLRRMSMLGDAISHAVLPGLVVAFMLSNSRDVLPMLLGAAVAGVLTAGIATALTRVGRVAEDAALGVSFTVLFALGVVMLGFLPPDLHLDASCVLYGSIETVSLELTSFLGWQVPAPTLWIGIVAAVNLALIVIFFKELRIVCFDAALAASMGISVAVVHYGLLTLVAATTVVSFEAVGSVLVVAMLIAPGATAHLLTDRLSWMVVIAGVAGAIAAVGGYLLALWLDTSVAGMMSVVAGGIFALAAVFSPTHGVLGRAWGQVQLALRISREDVLGILFRWREHARAGGGRTLHPLTTRDVMAALGRRAIATMAVWQLRHEGLATRGPGGALQLTEEGLAAASGIVRSHRLWETFLARRLGLAVDHLHEASHREEHFITPELQRELAGELAARVDPHGKPIPGGAG